MKLFTPAYAAHVVLDSTTKAHMWRLVRTDGFVFTATDLDRDIVRGGEVYLASSGYIASASRSSSGTQPDELQVESFIGLISIAEIEAGVWDYAEIVFFEVNYNDPDGGENILRFGNLGNVQQKKGQFLAELAGLKKLFQTNVGRVISAFCDADLGDERCGVDLDPLRVTGSIDDTSDDLRSTLTDADLDPAVRSYKRGLLTFTSGLNSGRSAEIKAHDVGGVLIFYLPTPFLMTIGDTFTLVPGCDKRMQTVRDASNVIIGIEGDCVNTYHNGPRNRSFPNLPGNDKILRGANGGTVAS